tara:strand:- start:2864 stop:3043 length:180 start_codon:yes stop_codon:yes gene_type:complete
MNAKQALNLLFQAAGMAALNREGHEQVVQAGQVLNELVKDIPDEEPKAPEPDDSGELVG